MKVRCIKLLLACASYILAAAVLAQPQSNFGYDYAEGGLSLADIDERSLSETEVGFNLAGSVALDEAFYVQGSWDRWDIGTDSFDLDTDFVNLGLGYREATNNSTDYFIEASYTRLDVGSRGDGFIRGDLGLRHDFGGGLEGRIYGGYLTDFSGGDTTFGLDGLLHLSRNTGVSLGYETVDFDLNIFRANFRLKF